jgi:hypothetical protein
MSRKLLKKTPEPINTERRSPQVEEPRLLWTYRGESYGTTRTEFPELQAVFDRRNSHDPSKHDPEAYQKRCLQFCLKEFLKSISYSTEHLLIVDPYFGRSVQNDRSTSLPVVREALSFSRVNMVRIVSHACEKRIEVLQSLRKARTPKELNRKEEADIRWRVMKSPRSGSQKSPLHDRFAVVDEELWHFGGDVGVAHPALTITSRGWDAREKRAVSFFDELWNGAQEEL